MVPVGYAVEMHLNQPSRRQGPQSYRLESTESAVGYRPPNNTYFALSPYLLRAWYYAQMAENGIDSAKFGDWKRREQALREDAALHQRLLPTCAAQVSRAAGLEICGHALDREGDCANAGAHLS